MTGTRVTNNAELGRYELLLGDRVVGAIDYRRETDALVLEHVEVAEESRGRGFGSQLVAGALDDVRAHGLKIVPQCAFAAWYLDQHPEQADLLANSVPRRGD